MWMILLALGCGAPPPAPAPEPAAEAPAPHWVKRTDEELAQVFRRACEASHADGRPLLLEFSAPWCLDCRALELLETHEKMQEEYAHWHRVRVDVGRFDRHPQLLEAFEVRSIANWVALRPEDCRQSPDRWRRLDQRVVELDSGAAREEGPEGLLMWLRMARSRG